MNGKHEEGAVKGLREDCACPISKIIMCNYLPIATRIAALTQDKGHKTRRKSKTKETLRVPTSAVIQKSLGRFCVMKKK